MNSGCAGISYSTKEPVMEPSVDTSKMVSNEELHAMDNVKNLIAVPIINEDGNSIGIFELFNCEQSFFESPNTKSLLMRFSKFVSLLFYTNGLLQVN